jgi:hypothetical protein
MKRTLMSRVVSLMNKRVLLPSAIDKRCVSIGSTGENLRGV